jgi:hypothetical protein
MLQLRLCAPLLSGLGLQVISPVLRHHVATAEINANDTSP